MTPFVVHRLGSAGSIGDNADKVPFSLGFASKNTPNLTGRAGAATGCPHRTVLPVPPAKRGAPPACPPGHAGWRYEANPNEKEKDHVT